MFTHHDRGMEFRDGNQVQKTPGTPEIREIAHEVHSPSPEAGGAGY